MVFAESETGSFKTAVFCARGIFKTENEKTLSLATGFCPALTIFAN